MGAHQADNPRFPPGMLRAFVASGIALITVVIVVVVLQQGSRRDDGFGPVVALPPGVPDPYRPPTDTPTPLPATTSARVTTPPRSTSPPRTTPPLPPVKAVDVRVLNYSRRSKLAQHVAGQLEAKGWRVVDVDNSPHRTIRTTVYFAAGQQRAAAALRREFPQIQAAEPAPPDLPGPGLTLVVTRDWPSG
jgi:hypothetical protein